MRRTVTILCMGLCFFMAVGAFAQVPQVLRTEEASKAERLLYRGDEIFRTGNYSEAGEMYKLAAMAAEGEKVEGIRAEALAQVARCYLIQDKKDEGRSWLKQAKGFISDQWPRAWSRYLGVRGRFEWKDGMMERATKTFKEMYDYCLKYELHSRAVDAAHMVAITAGHEEQIVWAQRGIEAAETGGLEGWLGPLWNNLGWTYEELGRYEESLDALRKAREYHWEVGGEQNKLVADWSVGHVHRKLNQMDEAEQWLRPVLAWAERRYADDPDPDRAEWVGHSCRELGEVAIAGGDLQEGFDLLRRAKMKLQEAKMPEWDPEDFQRLTARVQEITDQMPQKKVWHTVVHFEIPFDEGPRAASFYRELLGWEIVEVPELNYWLVNTVPRDDEGRPTVPGINGGLMKRMDSDHQIIPYIAVESVDEYLHRVESLGGQVIRPKTPISSIGWYAHVADSEGNVFGIMEEGPIAD